MEAGGSGFDPPVPAVIFFFFRGLENPLPKPVIHFYAFILALVAEEFEFVFHFSKT